MEECKKSSLKASGGTSSCSVPTTVGPIAQESKSVQPCDSSFSSIIVNTQNYEKEMIISRRSTYQKILAMENRGVQVVERDLILPVDMILDSTTCIVWYDSENIGNKVTSEDGSIASIPLCIENIAANVLTSLSFAFTTCTLVTSGYFVFPSKSTIIIVREKRMP